MAKHYIYSTLTSGMDYTLYQNNENGTHAVKAVVSIKGGANLPDKFLITPQGVVTEVDDEQVAILKQIPLFNQHVAAGFIVLSEARSEVESVVPDMVSRDKSAPLTPNDYVEDDNQAKPVLSTEGKKRR